MILDCRLRKSLQRELSERVCPDCESKPGTAPGIANLPQFATCRLTIRTDGQEEVILEKKQRHHTPVSILEGEKDKEVIGVNHRHYNIVVQFLARELAHLKTLLHTAVR